MVPPTVMHLTAYSAARSDTGKPRRGPLSKRAGRRRKLMNTCEVAAAGAAADAPLGPLWEVSIDTSEADLENETVGMEYLDQKRENIRNRNKNQRKS